MRVLVSNQNSNLSNEDIKWYLLNEKLWVTKYNEYSDVENSIEESIGSFNWLYEINDTLLFDKSDGKLKTVIIDLAGNISVNNLEKFFMSKKREKKGGLTLAEKKNCNFVFPSSITYVKNKDCLIAYSADLEKEELLILYIVDDFGLIIINDQLEGWILKNASKHVCGLQVQGSIVDNNPYLLAKYLEALRIWEEDEENIVELKNLLEIIESKDDTMSLIVKECIMNIL